MNPTDKEKQMQSLTPDLFLAAVPAKPMGRYAHIITLRITDGYALFQTDGELNTARVRAGEVDTSVMTRLTMFKRKQTTPERLTGRQLLRHYGFLSQDTSSDKKAQGSDGLPVCDYNVQFCTECPDCISYGFAIGDSGSEKSKVITDTAYSLTSYDVSHETFTLNAPFEEGTMSREGVVTSRINEQDHVQPQVIFPSIVTTRDLTYPLFLYTLNNVLRTRRYGAQTTRTGTMRNHVVGIVLADGEIFSNLKFTQRLYDALAARGALNPPDPIDVKAALEAASALLPEMLGEDGVAFTLLSGETLTTFLNEVAELASNETSVKQLLANSFRDSQAYHTAWLKKK
jgi:CRISPR-associated protein Csc2